MSYFDFDGRTVLPEGVFSIVASAVDILYPHKALVPTSLQLIRRLRDIIQSAPLVLALPLLLALQNSICKWLEDDQNVLVGDVRKEVVRLESFSLPLKLKLYADPVFVFGPIVGHSGFGTFGPDPSLDLPTPRHRRRSRRIREILARNISQPRRVLRVLSRKSQDEFESIRGYFRRQFSWCSCTRNPFTNG